MPIAGLRGHGIYSLTTDTPVSGQTFFPTRPTAITFSKESTPTLIQGFVNRASLIGQIQTTDTIQGAAEYPVEMTVSSVDLVTLQLLFGQYATSASFTRPVSYAAIVPATTFKVFDANLNGKTASQVTVTTAARSGSVNMTFFQVISTGTEAPTTSQVRLIASDTTTSATAASLLFASGLVGVPIDYSITQTDTKNTIGVSSAAKPITSIQFFGDLYLGTRSTGIQIYVPQIDLDGNWSLPMSGDNPEITISGNMVLASGRSSVIELAE